MALERVQKIIARAGISSRRQAEEFIRDGQVTINGKVAKLGDRAEAGKDAIKVSGKLLQLSQPPAYVAFNKPKGVICTVAPDPRGRRNVGSFLTQIKTRIFPIGLMDFNSEGLMLLTNDGDFAEKLQKSDQVPRIYHVKIKGHPDPQTLKDLTQPTRVDGKSIAPHSVRLAGEFTQKSMIEIVFVGSAAVDLKAFFEKKGFLVERIIRKSIGQINLHGLEPGHYRFLKKTQVDACINQPELALLGMKEAPEPAAPKPSRAPRIPKPLGKPVKRWTGGKRAAPGATATPDRIPGTPTARRAPRRAPTRAPRKTTR